MSQTESSQPSFVHLHPAFAAITGEHASFKLLLDCNDDQVPENLTADTHTRKQILNGQQNIHEACIYHAPSKSVFVTSNQLVNNILPEEHRVLHQATGVEKHVKLWRFYDTSDEQSPASVPCRAHQQTFPGWEGSLLNGGVNFGDNEILLCAQGSKNPQDLQGLIAVTIPESDESPAMVKTVLDSFYGIPFNSVNDVIVHPEDKSIWFTDPCYGAGQGIRPPPRLPNQLYRYDPRSKSARALADGFERCNGLCFSPDLKTLYVTDTGAIHGSPDVPFNHQGPSHIYAFDVVYSLEEPFLTNRRLFAYAPGKLPDGIKCDTNGNVYSGCGDGVEVWNPQGILLGIIKIDGGVANFCFGEKGELYACNETKFWKVYLNKEQVRGALLGL